MIKIKMLNVINLFESEISLQKEFKAEAETLKGAAKINRREKTIEIGNIKHRFVHSGSMDRIKGLALYSIDIREPLKLTTLEKIGNFMGNIIQKED